MNAEDRRDRRLQLQEDHIGRALRESEASGELKTAPSYGRPLDFGDGYDETPQALRMGYKILRDAGCVPPEVELMREITRLEGCAAAAAADDPARGAALQRIGELRQHLALRLEHLRVASG